MAWRLHRTPGTSQTLDRSQRFVCGRVLSSRKTGTSTSRTVRSTRRVPEAKSSAAPTKGLSSEQIAATPEWKALVEHVSEIEDTHLRDLLVDEDRCASMILQMPTREFLDTNQGNFKPTILLDYSRQRVTTKTMELLFALAEKVGLRSKIEAMFSGENINMTEDRAVLHVALRAPRDAQVIVDGKNVVPEVHEVLDKIKDFTEKVRSGEWKGATGKPLKDVVAIGIGGSYLGPEFIDVALSTGTHRMPKVRMPSTAICGPAPDSSTVGLRRELTAPGHVSPEIA